jgi:hypothetical protein
VSKVVTLLLDILSLRIKDIQNAGPAERGKNGNQRESNGGLSIYFEQRPKISPDRRLPPLCARHHPEKAIA